MISSMIKHAHPRADERLGEDTFPRSSQPSTADICDIGELAGCVDLIAELFCTNMVCMARRSGRAVAPRGGPKRARPAVDARLYLVVQELARLKGVSDTLEADDVVRAGLEHAGLKQVVDLVLAASVESKEDLDELAPKVRQAMATLELEGTQMMAS